MMREVYHVNSPDIVGRTTYIGKLGNHAESTSWVTVVYEAEEARKIYGISLPFHSTERSNALHLICNLYPSPAEAKNRKIIPNSIKFVNED